MNGKDKGIQDVFLPADCDLEFPLIKPVHSVPSARQEKVHDCPYVGLFIIDCNGSGSCFRVDDNPIFHSSSGSILPARIRLIIVMEWRVASRLWSPGT